MEATRFTSALKSLIDDSKDDIHTSLPARIVSVNYGTGQVEVAPLVQNVISTQKTQPYPNLSGVPLVVMSGGGKSRITFPVKPGDTGVVVFSERDPANALAGNGKAALAPSQLMSAGLYPIGFMPISVAGNAKTIDNTNVVLENDMSSAVLAPTGDITLKNSNGTIKMDSSGNITMNSGGATVTISASGSVQMVAPSGINLNGLKIDSSGQLTDGNGIVFQSHKHTGVQSGSDESGGPVN